MIVQWTWFNSVTCTSSFR